MRFATNRLHENAGTRQNSHSLPLLLIVVVNQRISALSGTLVATVSYACMMGTI